MAITDIPAGHEALRRASERSSSALEAKVVELERQLEALRAELHGRLEGPALVRRGERVVVEGRAA